MDPVSIELWNSREVVRLLALVEAERRFHQEIVEAIPVGLLVFHEAQALVSANRAFRRRFGLRPEEVPLRRLEDLFPKAGLGPRASAVVKSRIPQYDIPVEVAEVRFRVAILPASGWGDAEQEALLVFEEALDTPSAVPPSPRLNDFEAVFWQRDATTLRYTYVSPQAEAYFGYPAQRWLTEPGFWLDRIHPDDRQRLHRVYEEAARHRSCLSVEYRATTAAGARLSPRDTIRAAGDVLSVITVDLTERRHADWLKEQADRVEMLARVSGRLAHDLNNQLMIVSVYSEDLAERLEGEDLARGDSAEIIQATRRMAAITQELSEYSRLGPCAPQPLDIAPVLLDLEPQLRTAAGVAGLTIKIDPPLPVVRADRAVLEQALSTLVVHAAQTAVPGEPVILSSSAGQTKECDMRSFVTVSVTGGVQVTGGEQRQRMIEPLEDPLAIANPPLGAVMRRLNRCGADLEIAGEPGQHACWRIFLPVAAAAGAAPPQRAAEPSAASVLIAEEESGIRGLIRKALQRHNYQVLEAPSAEESLRIARDPAARIDLLITDVVLPGANGAALAQQIRKLRPQVKVVFMSGYSADAAIDPALVIRKPFTLSALYSKVRAVLSESVNSATAGH